MLIRFFRSSFLVQYVALLILGIALWAPAFLRPEVSLPETGLVSPLFQFLAGLLPPVPWLPGLAGLILVFAIALVLNSIFIYHDMVPKNSLLPALLFTLFMSSGKDYLTLYPALLAALPMTFFLHQVYMLYDDQENLNRALTIGILGALSSLLYTPLMVMVLFVWIVFLIYRMLHWREWLIALIGFCLPYLYLVVYYFWMDKLDVFFDGYFYYLVTVVQFTGSSDLLQFSVWIVFGLLLMLPSIVRILSTLGSQNIAFRRKMSVTVWLAIFATLMIITPGNIGSNNLLYLPAAGIVAYHLGSVKKSAWNELVILAYLVMIAVNNYL